MADCYTAPEEDVKANGSGGTGRFVTFAPEKPQQPLQSGFSSMKRGIHSFMSTMDAALKHSSQAANGKQSSIKTSSRHFFFFKQSFKIPKVVMVCSHQFGEREDFRKKSSF